MSSNSYLGHVQGLQARGPECDGVRPGGQGQHEGVGAHESGGQHHVERIHLDGQTHLPQDRQQHGGRRRVGGDLRHRRRQEADHEAEEVAVQVLQAGQRITNVERKAGH